jgi:plasmid maintenance system antidote protein VapI
LVVNKRLYICDMDLKEIKNKIEEKGLKHRWIANKLDIHYTALSQYLNDFRPMPDDVKVRLLKVID